MIPLPETSSLSTLLTKLPKMVRLVLPRENPRPDRHPGEIQRWGERARARAAAQGHGVRDEGKHRARLYAMHSFGALPRTRPLRGRRRINAENKKE